MSLQIVLITSGVILIIAVYLISIWLDRRRVKAKKSELPELHPSNIDDNIDDNDIPNKLDLDDFDQQMDDIPVLDDQVNEHSSSSDELEQHPADVHQPSESEQIKFEHEMPQAPDHQQIDQPQSDNADNIDKDEMLEDVAEEEHTKPDTREALGDPIDPQSTSNSDDIDSTQTPNWSLLKDTDHSAEQDDSSNERLGIKDEPQLGQGRALKSAPKTEAKIAAKIEPKIEPDFTAAVKSDSSSKYSYPNIEGFEKVSQIDYWVKLHGERDVGRESVLAQYREAKSALTKRSQILGLKTPTKNWCDLEKESEDARFGDLIVTIQLADQKGPVSESELAQFSKLINNLSAGTGRSCAFMAPLESALQQANAISDFVHYYESIFVVNIKPQHADYLFGSAINRCATQLGLERSEKNYFVRNKTIGKSKVCLYSLANLSDSGEFDFDNLDDFATREIIFFTKPAVNRSPGAVFSEMVDTAKAFAGRVKGHAVSPTHAELSRQEIEQIRVSIEKVAHDMEQHGMVTGSDEAIRIF